MYNSRKTEIESVCAWEILDSRANPTLKARVTLNNGIMAEASVPSGASVGKHEAHEKRDGGQRFMGRGCLMAAENVSSVISPALVGIDPTEQSRIDSIMIALDGTRNKSKLGANAILSVSLAVAKAAAMSVGLPHYKYLGGCPPRSLPRPMMNIINGGAHAKNNIDVQEFMIVPSAGLEVGAGIRACAEIYHTLKEILSLRGLSTSVGDEGGFAPNLQDANEGIEYILRAIEVAGYRPGEDISLALDVASSEWYDEAAGCYKLPKSGLTYTSEALAEYILDLCKRYPIISVEDGAAEDDVSGWRILGDKMRNSGVMLVGDDLFVSSPERLRMGIERGIANSILLKPNQIGTLSELADAARIAKAAGYKTVISHRSGDTADNYIADIGVGLGCEYIKSGAPCRSERVEKYNRLMEIERDFFEM